MWSRVVERRWNATVLSDCSAVAPRRRMVCLAAVRGLKPTATIVISLRETGRKCPKVRSRPAWLTVVPAIQAQLESGQVKLSWPLSGAEYWLEEADGASYT